jgi:dTDP-4-dehydrorhamnose reductase
MHATVLGTRGQLALALHRAAPLFGVELTPPRAIDIASAAEVEALLDANRPAVVLNAAAYTAVDQAEREAARAHAVNADGPRYLAEWCARNGAVLIHVSTDYVFDGTKSSAYVEDDATAPLGVYGASKLAGERAIEATHARHVIVRTSWVFSENGNNFVRTMLRLARERDELRVVCDQFGRPTSAVDLARAVLGVARIVLSGDNSADTKWGTYHFAGAGSTSWHGFAEAIVSEQAGRTGRRPRVTPITTAEYPTPARRPANSVLDTSRFERVFGIQPRPWQDELREVVHALVPAEPH